VAKEGEHGTPYLAGGRWVLGNIDTRRFFNHRQIMKVECGLLLNLEKNHEKFRKVQ